MNEEFYPIFNEKMQKIKEDRENRRRLEIINKLKIIEHYQKEKGMVVRDTQALLRLS
jgi:hypothetical protein